MLETIRVATYAVAIPVFLFSLYCAVAAVVSRIEDKATDPDNFTAAFNAASDEQHVEFLDDLPKAA